jgi:hypothetical protein
MEKGRIVWSNQKTRELEEKDVKNIKKKKGTLLSPIPLYPESWNTKSPQYLISLHSSSLM